MSYRLEFRSTMDEVVPQLEAVNTASRGILCISLPPTFFPRNSELRCPEASSSSFSEYRQLFERGHGTRERGWLQVEFIVEDDRLEGGQGWRQPAPRISQNGRRPPQRTAN